jgi:deoxyribonuclease-4
VKTAPRCARAHVNLGNAHYRQGRLDESILAYKQGLTIRPQYVKGYINLGEAYLTMKKFDEVLGLDRLKIIHANDSLKEFGSKRDRHEHIGKGFIGKEGFANFVNDRRLSKVPMIIETPKGEDLAEDIENLRVLRSLVKK